MKKTKHIDAIANGGGGPSMYMMVLAHENIIPATLSLTADTGWEYDCLLSDGRRVTMEFFYNNVILPLGKKWGIETAFVKAVNGKGVPLPGIKEKMKAGTIPGVPTFGSNGGRLMQGCTEKYKVRANRQELRRRGAKTASLALGLTLREVHRMKPSTLKWETVYYPLIDQRLYRSTINDRLNELGILYMVSSECDGCPHKDLARWRRTSPETIKQLAKIEKDLGGTQFLTPLRIPLEQAIEKMEDGVPNNSLFDICESGYCFT